MTTKRITRNKYEKARKTVEAAREQMKLIKTWDDAIRQIGTKETVDAIAIDEDGNIRFEMVYASISEQKPQDEGKQS